MKANECETLHDSSGPFVGFLVLVLLEGGARYGIKGRQEEGG